MLGEEFELKFDGFVDIEGPGKVFLVETLVLGAKTVFVEDAYIDQELTPGAFAVTG
jgi:hypothetical protein